MTPPFFEGFPYSKLGLEVFGKGDFLVLLLVFENSPSKIPLIQGLELYY